MQGRARTLRTVALLGVLILVVAVGLTASVRTGDGEEADREPRAADKEAEHERRPCRKRFVRREVRSFVRAAGSGSREAIQASLVDEPAFRVFSHTLDHRRRPDRFWMAKAKARVVSHLARRSARGDRIRLASLDTGSADRAFRICNIGFVVWRDIGDLNRPGERFVGKGAVSMDGGIAVWNTGGPARLLR